MNVNDAFPSKYLKASDLQGTEPIVTIEKIAFEPVGQTREMKILVFFRGKSKPLVLNRTNARAITEITGSGLTEEWVGQQVRLYAGEASFAGQPVTALRIKAVSGRGRMPMTPAPEPAPRRQAPPAETFPQELTADDISF